MKVLLTGHEGQLARSIIERGRGRPYEIVAVGRPQLDLEKPESLSPALAALTPDIIVNAAAYTNVDQAEDEPDRAFRINADAAGEIAQIARSANARIIQISTDYVFSGAQDQPYREDATTGPLNAYGRSKLAGERAVSDGNPDHLILRTAWVYSPFGRNFVKTMTTLAASRDSVTVIDDQVGNPSSALDLADGLLAVLDSWQQGGATGLGRTYHLAGSGEASWADVARQVFDRCAESGLPRCKVVPITTDEWPTKAKRPRNSGLDCSRFAEDFGYRMPDWRRGVTDTVDRILNESVRP